MALLDVKLTVADAELPADVRALLREADRRIERFQRDCHVPGFVPSDFAGAYRVLRALQEADAAPGGLFCEWAAASAWSPAWRPCSAMTRTASRSRASWWTPPESWPRISTCPWSSSA